MSPSETKTDIDFENISNIVLDNENNWINRGDIFYTFGAAAYLDGPLYYKKYAQQYNKLLLNCFSDVYEFLFDYFNASTHEDIALPGFHIFTNKGNGIEASLHKDLSYKKLPIYNETAKNAKSFTILLQKPDCGAGLNYWDNENIKHYIEYQLGHMYTHDDGLYHQIANVGRIKKGEHRITMQGHLIDIDEETYIYF